MTPDTLRQGAALVRALVEGDETARLLLSDWIEEHGLPGRGWDDGNEIARWLRSTLHLHARYARRVRVRRYEEDAYIAVVSRWPSLLPGDQRILGIWPLWAWTPDTV